MRSSSAAAGYYCRACKCKEAALFCQEEHEGLTYRIVYCGACALYQTVEHYAEQSPDYAGLTADNLDDEHLWRQGVHKQAAFDHCYKLVSQYATSPVHEMRLLDVGCGTGGFLRFAKSKGLSKLYGFDVSRAQIDYCRKEFPATAVATDVEEYLGIIEGAGNRVSFDVITMWDVLEHLREPLSFLEGLRRCSNRETLLFISIPNGGALRWKKAVSRVRPSTLALSPREHVFYYSRHSLSAVLERTGFAGLKHGAVACYPRRLGLFEAVRRVGFALLPASVAPQIYALARPTPE
jgi:2-polyprenyl-3-methyl-5-hydroxy-6-metoxy-1,4-benzoquinol methylase